MGRLFPAGGVSWAVLDRRGSGESEGDVEDISIETTLGDVDLLCDELGWPEGGFVGLGHSFGALLLLEMLIQRPRICQAVILSSPFFGMPDNRSPLEILLYTMAANLMPQFTLKEPVPPHYLTHDEIRIQKYSTDTRVQRDMTLGVLKKIDKKQKQVKKLDSLQIPLLMLRGSEEKIVSQKMMEEWYKQCQAPLKEGKVFPSLRHELYNELGNEPVFETTRNFLERIWSE